MNRRFYLGTTTFSEKSGSILAGITIDVLQNCSEIAIRVCG